MKTVVLTLLTIASLSIAYADLTVVQDLGGEPLSDYVHTDMESPNIENALKLAQSNIENSSINASELFNPQSQSEFTPGIVTRHRLSSQAWPMPFYLIGGDQASIKWATQNAAYLKSIHAVGMIVNVAGKTVQDIETKTGLSLLPGNVNGLSAIIGTTHYPFLVYQGWVTQ